MLPVPKHLRELRQDVHMPLKPPWASFTAKIAIVLLFSWSFASEATAEEPRCLVDGSVKNQDRVLNQS